MVRVTTPRVDSQMASRRTRHRRSEQIGSVRQVVSGGAQIQQLQDEVGILGEDDRRQLLLQSKPLQVQIPVDEGLAMKTDLGIPWNEMRTLRRLHNLSSTNLNRCDIPVYSWIRWMKAWGVSIASERKQRALSKELVGNNLASEAALFSFPMENCGEELRPAPLVYVPDLSGKIVQLLEQNDRYLSIHLCIIYRITQNTFLKLTREGRLTSHKGVIPPGQIWIKLGGDKGGSSMKMSFQICNLRAPNSVKNTCIFAAFQAGDTITNLHVALDRYQEQVNRIESLTWR